MTDKISKTPSAPTNLVRDTTIPNVESVEQMHVDPVIPGASDTLGVPKSPKDGIDSYDETGPGISDRGA